MKTALIIESCPITAKVFKNVLEKTYQEIDVSCSASYQAANHYLLHTTVDIILININSPDTNGLDIVKPLLKLNPESYIVVISMLDADCYVIRTVQNETGNYLIKGSSNEFLIKKMKIISEDEVSLLASPSPTHHFGILIEERCIINNPHNLTHREKEVLTIIAKGYNRKETSHLLTVAESTVASHIHNIYAKLSISSRSEATLEACKMNLLSFNE